MRAVVPSDYLGAYWIGLYDANGTMPMQWTDGTGEATYNNWGPNHPQSGECGAFGNDPFWWDLPCRGRNLPYVCCIHDHDETEPPTQPPHQKHYWWSPHPEKWHKAKEICHEKGGHMPSLHSEEEEHAFRTWADAQHYEDHRNSYHMGYKTMEGHTTWVDHTPFDYFNWGNAYHPEEGECGVFNKGDPHKLWWDQSCTKREHFACELYE